MQNRKADGSEAGLKAIDSSAIEGSGVSNDEFWRSPELPYGQRKAPAVCRPLPRTTDDEAYQFRRPNVAYNDGAAELSNLPDGLVTDGTYPRHFGDEPVRNEDNKETLRHNSFAAVEKQIEGQGYTKKAAGAILAKKTREASPAAKKANSNLKKVPGA